MWWLYLITVNSTVRQERVPFYHSGNPGPREVTVLSKVTLFAVVHLRVVLGGAECFSLFDLSSYPERVELLLSPEWNKEIEAPGSEAPSLCWHGQLASQLWWRPGLWHPGQCPHQAASQVVRRKTKHRLNGTPTTSPVQTGRLLWL